VGDDPPREVASTDRADPDEDVDALASLRRDAPPLWGLLGRGQAAAAISAGNAWLDTRSHPDAVVAVDVARSVAYLVTGERLGAVACADGALGAGLVADHEELPTFLGISLQSVGISLQPGRLAALVEAALRRLATCSCDDAWLLRWATFQFRFARILLRNRREIGRASCRERV